jgi:ABC-2 type transport system permease protein
MMRIDRVSRVAQRVWSGLYRDPRALPALVLVPVGTLLLVGYVMRNTQDAVGIAIVVTANDFTARDVTRFVEESLLEDDIRSFRVRDIAEAESVLRDGDADAFVVIDRALVNGVLSNSQETVTVGVRGDDQGNNDDVLRALEHALSAAPLKAFNIALGAERPPPGGPLNIDARYLYGGEEFETLDHAIPALVAFASFLAIFTIALVAFTRERFDLTIERMLSTSATRGEIIVGFMVGYGAEALLQTGLIIVVVVALGAHHAGSLMLIALVTLITSIVALNLGMLLSAFARTEPQAMQMLPLILVPQFVLGGVLFPLDSLPGALRVVSHLMPMTYSVQALRDLMIRDFTLADSSVLWNLAVLVAFAAAFLWLAARTLGEETR